MAQSSAGPDTTSQPAHDGGEKSFVALGIAVMAVSDTRDLATDDSGALLAGSLEAAGHDCVERVVVRDEVEAIRAQVRAWARDDRVQVILITGGTGVTRRDVTPEAVEPLYDKPLPGFGELFRWLSFRDIGTSTIQSRATAGVIGATLVFALPGSRNACRLAWDEVLQPQLDARTKPCAFPGLMQRM
ncbi:MAG TPA: molybdenum cofactor biosynthesis protein B [Planctomycetota bacterium]